MTRRANPPAIPELAKHHARPPHRLRNIHVDADGKINIMPTPENVAYANRVWEHWGPNLIDNAERRMEEILAAAGMPTEAGVFQRTGLHDWFRGLDKLAQYRGHTIGSKVWYAAKIIEDIADLRDARKRKDDDLREHLAFHLGALMDRAAIIVDYPGVFDLGLKQSAALERAIPAAAKLRRDDAAKDHQKWIDAARVIWENEPRLSRKKCAETIINDKHLFVTNQTVRKIISPYKPKVGNNN